MALTVGNIPRTVILTDSASCLSALEAEKSQHSCIQEIEQLINHKNVRLCWIPGHAGINGNVKADRLANEVRSLPVRETPIPAEDAMHGVKQNIRSHWHNQLHNIRDTKLREIKYDTAKWTDRSNAADQRMLTRLRIGHTRLTHTFLLKRRTRQPVNAAEFN